MKRKDRIELEMEQEKSNEHSEKWRESAKLIVFVVVGITISAILVRRPGSEALGGMMFGVVGCHAIWWALSVKEEYYSKVE